MVTPADDRRLGKPNALLPHCIPAGTGTWADIGCGDGVFTTVLQRILGLEGRVIAIDRDGRALKQLVRRFKRDHPGIPVETIRADLRTPLDLPTLDGFVAANVLHFFEVEARRDLLARLATCLRPAGLAVVVEYNTHDPNGAVPFPLPPDGFLTLAEEAGLAAARIAARVPSSFLEEMYAGVASKTNANVSA